MIVRIALLLGTLLTLAGCQTAAIEPVELAMAQSRGREFASRMSYGAYALRPSDQLRVQVYDDPNITGDYQVDSGGFVSIPLAGRIKASGLTTAQLERVLIQRLSDGVLKKPNVTVQLTSYGPIYVHGEVKRGGEFPYRPGLTVRDAIALAGGYTYRADETTAYVTRAGTPYEREQALAHSVRIFPGDNIRIPERFF
jgi:polysaccharide export outer membrane protein